jgi:hypothetical protein
VSQHSADKYRRWAAQCLSLAAKAERNDDKSTWLELAGKWQRLSEEAASRAQQAERTPPEEKSAAFKEPRPAKSGRAYRSDCSSGG